MKVAYGQAVVHDCDVMPKMDDVIDAHVHVWTDDRTRYPRAAGIPDSPPARFTPEDYLAHAVPNGVRRTVLIQMSFYRFDNSYMLDSMRTHPGIFCGIGIVDSEKPHPQQDMKELAQKGVRGFRIVPGKGGQSWLDSPGMNEMWKYGASARLAMCPLLNPDALPMVDRMCTRFPDTTVVIDHLARIGADGEVRDADIRRLSALAKHPNVHVKVSAFYALGRKKAPYLDLAPLIRRVFEDFGPRRLMWASDCPFQVQDGYTYESSISLVRDKLDFLTPDDREWLLRRTAQEVFFSR